MTIDISTPALDYGRTPRQRRWKLWTLLLIVLVAIGIGFRNRAAIRRRTEVTIQYYDVLHSTRPTRQLTIAEFADRDLKTPREILDAFAARVRPWGMSPNNTLHHLALLTAMPLPPSGTGNPAVAFIGTLTTASGHQRLVVLSFNLMVRNDATKAFLSFDAELYDVGSYLNPEFRVVPVRPTAATRPSEGHVYAGLHWVRFLSLTYLPGAACEIGAGEVNRADSAVARIPISFDGHPDALLFTLDDHDRVSARTESGNPIPLGSE